MMKKLFLGFLFIYLNFDLSFNQFTLNVFPDFVGYIFLLQGVKELDAESSLFRGIRPFATGMVVYTAILWVGKLMGLTAGGNWVATLLELISTAVSLYISWVLIQGVLDMEQHHGADLNGKTLYDCPPDEFVKHTKEFSELGGALFGGCCGTGPEHIAKIATELHDFELRKPDPQYRDKIVCATEKDVFILEPGIKAGEIIDCGPDLEDKIRKANKSDSQFITIKISCEPDLDEFEAAQYAIRKPLCIVCDDAALLNETLTLYQGRALYAGNLSDEELAPMVYRYGLII